MINRQLLHIINMNSNKSQNNIVLPEGDVYRILHAGYLFVVKKNGKITLLGNVEIIIKKLMNLGFNVEKKKINFINNNTTKFINIFYKTLYKVRIKIKIEEAKTKIYDVSYFGTMMVYKGLVYGMVSGAVHTTSETIRPVLKLIKNNYKYKTVSSIFFMVLNNYVVFYGDCAIVKKPDPKQLAEIAITAAITAINFEIKPIIALLSYSTGNSGYGIEVEKVKKAVELVKIYDPNLLIEGPIQYDAAVSSLIGKKKMPNSKISGKANIIIFPDLNTGNISYKAVQRETKCIAIGPILQGINKPITDLSRGATIEDIYHTIILTSIQI